MSQESKSLIMKTCKNCGEEKPIEELNRLSLEIRLASERMGEIIKKGEQ